MTFWFWVLARQVWERRFMQRRKVCPVLSWAASGQEAKQVRLQLEFLYPKSETNK